jgi:hydrogenase maturation protease
MTSSKDSSTKKILIAGVGNRLLSDDGFGPRVIDFLSSTPLPENVEARDIGTAGLTIATDLIEYDLVIFVDSVNIDGEPGQLYTSDLVVKEVTEDIAELSRFTLHEVGLEGLLKFAKAIDTLPSKVILIGCKPKNLGPSLDLSLEVEKNLHKAAEIALAIVEDYLSNKSD